MGCGEDVCPRCGSTQVTDCWVGGCPGMLEPDDDECPACGSERDNGDDD